MPWFAAHAVMYFQYTDGPQGRFLVWENILLLWADSPTEAFTKAVDRARRDEGDSLGSLRVSDRPATLVFGGIRKLISVSHERDDGQLGDGDEITYSEFEVMDDAGLRRLIDGEEMALWDFE